MNRAKRETRQHALLEEKIRRRRRLAVGAGGIIAAFVLFAFVFGGSLLEAPGPGIGVRVGDEAPDFTVTTVDGDTFRLSAQRGHPVLLDFMGSRCPTCELEMPHLVETYTAFSDRGLVIISIDVGGSLGTEDPDVARAFLAAFGGTWPIALDNSGVGLTYRATGTLPTIYIVDPDGRVVYRNPGFSTAETLATVIEDHV